MSVRSLAAGAAGIIALDAYTYLDMLVRGRPASSLPESVVQKLAGSIGLTPLSRDDDETARNRRQGAGPLLGYGVGLGTALVFGMAPRRIRRLPAPLTGIVLGCVTLALSEGTATALGATNWATWTASDWLSDIVPRTLYGLTVSYVLGLLDDEPATP